jgi:hypothetical protein
MHHKRTLRHLKYLFTISFSAFLLTAFLLSPQIKLVDASRNSAYESGYSHGCKDAKISNPSDRYINQPGKGPNHHTSEFMQGYDEGYNACLNRSYQSPYQAPPSLQPPQPSPSYPNYNWIQICSSLDPVLVSSCNQLVNRDNTLTYDGQRAYVCIRNGILLAGGSALLNLPLPVIIATLRALSTMTGCGGIVDWGPIDDVRNLLNIIGIFS